MKRLLSGLALSLSLVIAAPATAADLRMPVKAPTPVAVATAYNWTGLYIGAHCGWAQTRTSTSNEADGGFDSGDLLIYSNNASGATCGGQWGFNWQASNVVLGLEGDIAWVGIKRERSGIGLDDDLVAVRYSWLATFTGRLGLTFDRALFYAKGGAALARIKNTATDLDGGVIDPADFSEVSKSRWGWAVGGGVEYGFTPNWSLKAEYMFHDFGSYTTPLNLDGESFTHKNKLHTVKFGINYRFGGAPVVARY